MLPDGFGILAMEKIEVIYKNTIFEIDTSNKKGGMGILIFYFQYKLFG